MPRVLVVDDDAMLADMIKVRLQHAGFMVNLAVDGLEGLNLLSSLSPQVVLLDTAMPRLDGLAVLEEVRRTPKLAQTPMIMMTARGKAADVQAAVSRGATDYLVKPFSFDELLRKVRRALPPSAQLA